MVAIQDIKWTYPLFEAFCNGAWLLYWTSDTLYWIAKPTVHTENRTATWYGRLHNDVGPAVESDLENWYFVHGVMIPANIIEQPESVTAERITNERNAEIRRIMLDRFGAERYLTEINAKPMHSDDWGVLYRVEMPDDEDLVMVKVVNSTPEPGAIGHFEQIETTYNVTQQEIDDTRATLRIIDASDDLTDWLERHPTPGDYSKYINGSFIPDPGFEHTVVYKDYFLRVPPTCTTALEAVAWTFEKTPAEYCKVAVQT